jgi:GAF domain-containing protein
LASSPLIAVVSEFTNTILNPYDLQELLHRLSGHAAALTGAQGAGIMLAGRGEGSLGFAAATDERAVEMELVQDRIEQGACYDAFMTNELNVVEDLKDDGRWPDYEQRAMQLGLRAVLAVPMNASGQTIGVINIYREQPGPWSSEDVEAAQIVTAMGAAYVLHANQLRAQHDLADQLQTALESRDLIGQAKGILMIRHGIDAETAFEQLRKVSQDANLKLRDVARSLVSSEAAHVE